MPKALAELEQVRQTLENHFKDVQDFEFTIEDGKAVHAPDPQRQTHRRWPPCAFAVEMVKEKLIDWETAVTRVPADQLDQVLAPVFDRKASQGREGHRQRPARRPRRGHRPHLFQRRPRRRSRATRAKKFCSSASKLRRKICAA